MIALMVGGAMDAQVIDTANVPSIRGMEPPKPGLDPDTGITWGRHVEYVLTEVEVLSLKVRVFILDGWPQERIEATLAAALLSDLAHRLAQQ